MKNVFAAVMAVSMVMISSPGAFSHCEIPCGIYGDQMRIDMIAEDITTIEKSMKQIVELSGQKEKDFNQIVRWVENKEHHADKIQHVVSQYFMTQRIKPVDAKDASPRAGYVTKLTLLHEMLVFAMKAKQTTDLANVARLRELLAGFQAAYFGEPGAGSRSN